MDTPRRTLTTLCITVLLVAVFLPTIAMGAVVADGQSSTGTETPVEGNDSVTTEELTTGTDLFASPSQESTVEAQSADGPSIDLTQDLSLLPDEPGTYEVTHDYSLAENAALLQVTLPEEASVDAINGFVQRDDRTYEWDGDTDGPSITYRLGANRSVDGSGPIDASGRYLFVDVGDWALVTQPRASHQWGWRGERVGFTTEMTTDQGVTSDVIAYLGEYDKETYNAHDQEFQLIIPEAASLAEEPSELFASLGDASDSLRVGERDEVVFMVAAPTERVDWGVRGLQTGPADLWVRDFETLDEAANVWLHEYVHTRQGYTAATDFRWFTEATATYYAALLTYEQDRIEFSDLARDLSVGERQRFGQSVLTNPQSWASAADYRLGALVAGAIDKDIREETDGEQSLAEVFRQVNAHEGIVTASDFEESVMRASSEEVSAAASTYTGTTNHPEMWDEATHATVFDQVPPARITFSLADRMQEPSVSGPYRDRGVGTTRPITVVPNETLDFGVIAENFGGLAGEYNASMFLNDKRLTSSSGMLGPGATETLNFNYTFMNQGEKQLTVGDVTLPVSVVEPAVADVTSFTADRTTVEPNETVTLTATVENSASYPGERTLSLAQNNDLLTEETVRLDGGSTTTVTFNATVSESGPTVFSLGDIPVEPVIVTAEESTEVNETTDGTDTVADDDGAGFGVVSAIASLAMVSVWFLSRRDSGRLSG